MGTRIHWDLRTRREDRRTFRKSLLVALKQLSLHRVGLQGNWSGELLGDPH